MTLNKYKYNESIRVIQKLSQNTITSQLAPNYIHICKAVCQSMNF